MARGRGKNAPDRADELAEREAALMATMLQAMTEGMPPAGAARMRQLSESGTALKVLKPEDMPLLAQYADFWQVYTDAREGYMSQPEGMRTREETATGFKANSDIKVMREASDQMMKIAKQTGLTPVARAQLRLTDSASASLMATAFPERMARMFELEHGKG